MAQKLKDNDQSHMYASRKYNGPLNNLGIRDTKLGHSEKSKYNYCPPPQT